MLISMTGFGRAQHIAPFGRLVAEIQSVNRKHLEIFVSLPREMNRFEMEIRKWVSEAISRGQVSVRLNLTPSEEALSSLLPDSALLKKLNQAWTQLAIESGCSKEGITLPFLLQYLPSSNELPGAEEEQLAALKRCVMEALEGLCEMRTLEGKALSKDLTQRLAKLEKMAQAIEGLSPQASEKLRIKLKERLSEVLEMGEALDERIGREIALFAERIDISEEITRLHSHIAQFRTVIGSKGAAGRKLEFLVQEMGREINTIGSKSADAEISHLVVECKSELEKVREQIQNIE